MELKESIKGIVDLGDDLTPEVNDEERLHGEVMDNLIETALFHKEDGVKELCQVLIRSISRNLGAYPASIQNLYEAMGRGEAAGFTVPAINIRG